MFVWTYVVGKLLLQLLVLVRPVACHDTAHRGLLVQPSSSNGTMQYVHRRKRHLLSTLLAVELQEKNVKQIKNVWNIFASDRNCKVAENFHHGKSTGLNGQ